MKFEGNIFKYGDNINTDVIIPARYLNDASAENLKSHAMEDLDIDFHKIVKDGDIIVAGKNFGSGSSREHAPLALKQSGIKLIVAQSFARIFYRNAINIGLYVVEEPELFYECKNGDNIRFENYTLTNLTQNKVYHFAKPDDFVTGILEKGGLLNAVRKI